MRERGGREWTTMNPLSEGDVTDLQLLHDDHFVAVTSDGYLLTGTLSTGIDQSRKINSHLQRISIREGRIFGVGGGGTVVTLEDERVTISIVDPDVLLSDLSWTQEDELYVVGGFDYRSGAIFHGMPDQDRWAQILPKPGQTHLSAIIPLQGGAHLLTGYRGYLAILENQRWDKIETGTEHPLNAMCVDNDSWLVGGGGWAEHMPILLRGDRDGLTPLLSAKGDKIIHCLARDNQGQIWVTLDRFDGTSWAGGVYTLVDETLELVREFPDCQLYGVVFQNGVPVVFGRKGFVAFADR